MKQPDPEKRPRGISVAALRKAVADISVAALQKTAAIAHRLYRVLRVRWRRSWHEHLPVMIVLAAGTLLSLGGYLASRHYLEIDAQHEFDREASHHVRVVQNAIDTHLEAVQSATRFISGGEVEVDRWSFYDFAKAKFDFDNTRAFPGIQSVLWIPYVAHEERAGYERKARADGLFGFTVTESNFGEGLVEANDRPEYFPVDYAEPTEGNEKLLGFDMASVPVVLEALERARDTAALTVTPDLPIAVGNETRHAVLVVDPVYRKRPVPASVDGRRAALKGFVVGLINPADIVDRTVALYTTPAWLDMYLYDGTAGGEGDLLHFRPSPLRQSESWPITLSAVQRGRHMNEAHKVGDHGWSIVVSPVPGRMDFKTDATPYGVAAFGGLLTLLLAGYFVILRNRRRMIEEKVAERTAELSAANRSLANEVQQRKKVARALRKAKEEAEVANHAKSGFLAMISHELRTPLNAIIGFSEVLSAQMFGPLGHEKYTGYSEDIRSSGRHLLGLINNILDLTKVEANEFNLRRQDMNLAEVIDEVMRLFENQAQEAAQAIDLDLEKPLPLLHADPGAVRQILINLLSNALKFTPEGGLIGISARSDDDGGLTITVADNGIGIAKEDIDGIFQPFSQVDSSLARQYEGTGLGLPLTRSLVELHGGTIDIESAPQQGTTVRVTFEKDMVIPQDDTEPRRSEEGSDERVGLR